MLSSIKIKGIRDRDRSTQQFISKPINIDNIVNMHNYLLLSCRYDMYMLVEIGHLAIRSSYMHLHKVVAGTLKCVIKLVNHGITYDKCIRLPVITPMD